MVRRAGPIIGAHVSTAGGLPNAVLLARHIGADAIQIFGSSPRQWEVRLPSVKDANAFGKAFSASGLRDVFLHAPYLINLASEDRGMWRRSVAALAGHLKIANMIRARGVIVHVGSGVGGMFQSRSLELAASGAKQALRQAVGKSALIIENSAGGGEKIGKNLAEIAKLMRLIGSRRVGVCLDTAHSFESGIVKDYTKEDVARFAAEIKRTIGWKRLLAIHANDSKTAWNSKHDRHENIGAGHIGLEGFKNLLAHPEFRKIPFLLEVPGFAGEGPDKKNVDILRKLAGERGDGV